MASVCPSSHLAGYPRQRGGILLLALSVLTLIASAIVLHDMMAPGNRLRVDPMTHESLQRARQALLIWAGKRITTRALPNTSDSQPGLLPYPDRNRDGNYDGYSDCPSISADSANGALRIGRLPMRGWTLPCREDLRATQASAIAALHHTEIGNELLWFAASRHVLDTPTDIHPDTTPTFLMETSTDWLVVCDQSGRLITDRAALILLAPGRSLAGQDRSGDDANISNYLDAFALSGSPPCNNRFESNADGNNVFIANSHGDTASFNDNLLYVSNIEIASKVAVSLAQFLADRYLLPYRAKQGYFPYGATVGSLDGACVDGVLHGRLPLKGAPCFLLGPLPLYIDQVEDVFYRRLTYERSRDGGEAELRFESCSIRFRISASGLSYFPRQC